MRLIRWTAFLAVMFLAALLARGSSTGSMIIGTGQRYLDLLASGDTAGACSLLTDSLAGMIDDGSLAQLDAAVTRGGFTTGRMEQRGLPLSVESVSGGSRTLWLRSTQGDGWRISGDSSLDNVLGSGTMLCSSFARRTVVPAVSGGEDPSGFACPVSGAAYELRNGLLVCPSGHLGNGIDTGGSACSARRDSLAGIVLDYVSEGYAFPSSFQEMFAESQGRYGQRGGYHCPDDGYSYYTISGDGIFCPFHGRTTVVDLPPAEAGANERE